MPQKKNTWNAADYAENSSAQELWASELIEKLSLKGNECVLDLGCGDGKITASIADRLPRGKVVGIDRSEEMIALAGSLFDRDNLSFHLMDVTDVSLPDKFHVVFSNAALHWVHDHKAILTHLKRNLHPGAQLLLQMGGYGNADDILAIVTLATRRKEWERYFDTFVFPYRFCKVREYEKWLQQTGYVANRIELIAKDMVHENPDKLMGWLRTTWFPYTDQLPEDEKERFLSSVVREYLSQYPVDSDGQTHVRMVRLEVEATAG